MAATRQQQPRRRSSEPAAGDVGGVVGERALVKGANRGGRADWLDRPQMCMTRPPGTYRVV